MADISKTKPEPTDTSTVPEHGVPAGIATSDSPGVYRGNARLQSEVGPLQPDPKAGKDQAKDI